MLNYDNFFPPRDRSLRASALDWYIAQALAVPLAQKFTIDVLDRRWPAVWNGSYRLPKLGN